jgi:adenosylcobinamide-phosphate synthase
LFIDEGAVPKANLRSAKLEIYRLIDYGIAVVADWLIGDPYWLYHPVRAIGRLIQRTEMLLRRFQIKFRFGNDLWRWEKFLGIILTLTTVGLTFGAVWLIVKIAAAIHPILFHFVNIYFLYSAFATRCMADEALKVHDALLQNDLPRARQQTAMLVGRETGGLNRREVIRAVVESTAENTVDGVVSPIFYAVIGSCFGLAAPFVYAFKAVSTLDSMVGYKNERYLHFGWASARLDDIANYLPARLSGLLIPLSFWLMGKGFRESFITMLRDRRKHSSPNCAYPEAAVAGGLGVQLGGANIYFGRLVQKPAIGDPARDLVDHDILQTVKMLYYTSALAGILGLLVIAAVSLS